MHICAYACTRKNEKKGFTLVEMTHTERKEIIICKFDYDSLSISFPFHLDKNLQGVKLHIQPAKCSIS